MNLKHSLVIALSLGLFTLGSCNKNGATPSLGNPNIGIPDDDGTLFKNGGNDKDRIQENKIPNDGSQDKGGSNGGNNGGNKGGGHKGGGSNGGPGAVPEPATLLLLGSGLAGAAMARRRKRKALELQEGEGEV